MNDIVNLLEYGTVAVVMCFVFMYLIMVILPLLVLTSAIKKINKIAEYDVVREEESYFLLNNGIRVYKKFYNMENDCYICEYGYFIPVYDWKDTITEMCYIPKK